MKKYSIDEVDRAILNLLLQNSDLSYQEIAERVFISPGTVHLRIKKMKQAGIILGSRLQIAEHLLGFDITCFIGIFLEKSAYYETVADALEAMPEVVEVHYTTGAYSIFLKAICRDTAHLRTFLHDRLQKLPGVQRTETLISLEERFNRPHLLSDN